MGNEDLIKTIIGYVRILSFNITTTYILDFLGPRQQIIPGWQTGQVDNW